MIGKTARNDKLMYPLSPHKLSDSAEGVYEPKKMNFIYSKRVVSLQKMIIIYLCQIVRLFVCLSDVIEPRSNR